MQYSIESQWQGKTAGNICPPKAVYHLNDPKPEYIQLDSDERWFNNTQFRIKVFKDTKIYISLMQENEKLSRVPYIKTNFMVITARNKKIRIWERPDSNDIICDAASKKGKFSTDLSFSLGLPIC